MKRIFFSIILIFILQPLLYTQEFYPNPYLEQLDQKYTSGLFRGGNAYYLVPMHDLSAVSYLTVFQYLQGRVPGLMISSSPIQRPYVSYRMGRPAFYLDEMRVDASLIANVPMSDIAFIKVFRPPFVGVPGGGAGGAIAVYTLQGDEE